MPESPRRVYPEVTQILKRPKAIASKQPDSNNKDSAVSQQDDVAGEKPHPQLVVTQILKNPKAIVSKQPDSINKDSAVSLKDDVADENDPVKKRPRVISSPLTSRSNDIGQLPLAVKRTKKGGEDNTTIRGQQGEEEEEEQSRNYNNQYDDDDGDDIDLNVEEILKDPALELAFGDYHGIYDKKKKFVDWLGSKAMGGGETVKVSQPVREHYRDLGRSIRRFNLTLYWHMLEAKWRKDDKKLQVIRDVRGIGALFTSGEEKK